MRLVGELIDGRYRVQQQLGYGGVGVVFRAMDESLERLVAIRFLLPALRSNLRAVQRFQAEAQAMASVKHLNVVGVYASGRHRGTDYVVTELMVGSSAEELLRRWEVKGRHLPLRQALEIAERVSRGLGAVHRARCVHRDVRPANVMVESGSGRVVLMDCDVSYRALLEGGATPRDRQERLPFLAPELFSLGDRSHAVDVKADIYSLGVTAYLLITGTLPVRGSTLEALAVEHARQQVTAPSVWRHRLPSGLDEVVLWALRKRPSERPREAEDLGAGLRRFMPDTSPSAPLSLLQGSTPPRWRLVLTDPDTAQLEVLVRAARQVAPRARVSTSNSIAGAISLVRKVGADLLVVSDDEDGAGRAELARALIHSSVLCDVHVIVTTQRQDELTRARLLANGADQVMRRPLRHRLLAIALEAVRP